jgi:hypothetical protein
MSQLASAVISAVVSLSVAKLSVPSTERRAAQVQRRLSLLVLVDELNAEGCVYWRSIGRDAARESTLKTKLYRLFFQLGVYFDHAKDESSRAALNGHAIDAQNAITGGAFEVSDRPIDLAVVAEIKRICTALGGAISALPVDAKRKVLAQ